MNNITEFKDKFLGEKYYKIDHKSGLTVFVFPKKRQSSFAILTTEFGSIDNKFYDENNKLVKLPDGIAHFMEHKMFDNAEGENVDDLFSKLGADPNAYTSWDHTAYFYSCNSGENFYKCLDNLLYFVTTPYFTKESVNKEQGIIGQEILMCEDDPYDRCFLGMIKGLYKKHPARIDVVGSIDSIAKITPKMLYKCHQRFYNPSNMSLVLCGVAEVEKVLGVVDARLSDVEPVEKLVKSFPKECISSYQKRVECKMQVERSLFCLGFKDSKAPAESILRRKRQIIAEILMGVIFSSSNELYTSLFKRGIMTTPFNYGEEYGKSFSLCYAGGECDDSELLFSEIKKYIKKLKKKGIKSEDFERRKKIIYASDIKIYDSTWDIANALVDNSFCGIDIFSESKIVESITLDDANSLLSELCKENNMTYSVVYPN